MTLAQQLATLESSGLIRLAAAQPEIEYLFRHALIYDAVHGSITKQIRSQLHALVGEILEQQYPDRLSSRDLAPLLAYHFDQGQDNQRALKYYIAAGDAAFATFANREAIAHYSRAIELAKHDQADKDQLVYLYARRGRAYELSGQYPLAHKNYLELRELAHSCNDRSMELTALISLATIFLTPSELRDQAQGTRLLDQSLLLARELNDRAAEVKILWNTLLLHRFDDTPQSEVIAVGEQALRLARELDLKEQTAYILNDLNISYFMAGQFNQGLAVLHEAQVLWRELNNLAMLADSLSGEVETCVYVGKFDRAVQLYHEARQVSESIGNLWNQSYSRYIIGMVYFERGEISEAIQIMTDCIRLAKEAGFIVAQAQTRCDLALVYAFIGQYQTAFELLAVAEDVTRQGFPIGTVNPISIRARIHLRLGQLAEADAVLAPIDISTYRGMQYYTVYYWLAASEAGVSHQDYAGALATLDRFESELSLFRVRPMEYEINYLRGRALIGLQRFDDAEAALLEAKQLAEELGSRRILWQILIAMSEIEMKRGREMAAYKLRQQAQQIIETIAGHIDQIDLRESFMNLPQIRSVLSNE